MKSWIEISGAKLADNFRAVQSVAGAGVEVLAVIKADAYGHNAELCGPVLAQAGALWLGVSDCEEGIRVREAIQSGSTRILVMCGMESNDAPKMIANRLTPVVWTAAHVRALERAAAEADTRCRVHLEIDTGMSRQGAAAGATLQPALEELNRSPRVFCEGVMTHFCCSEVAGSAITEQQCERFLLALEQVHETEIVPKFVHFSNTSALDEERGTQRLRAALLNSASRLMVRTGLALYGHCLSIEAAGGGPAHAPSLAPKLSPVMCWKTRVIGLREISAGTTVGYGASFTATRDMRLALLPVGYADGFRREASSGIGNGWVMVQGQRALVVGRVSMNLTTVDVTGIADVREGTEVVLLGEGVSAADHARWSATIPYDILCGIRGDFLQR